eukprot:COSAG06_NODE_9456_length_1896_cov_3.315526_2_plen_342_part_01
MEQEAIVSFQSQNKSTVNARPGLFGTLPTVAVALWAPARSSQPRVSFLLLPPWWFSRCFLLLRGALSLVGGTADRPRVNEGFRGVGCALLALRLAPLPLQLPPLALLCGGLLRDAAVEEVAERARHVGLRRGCRPILAAAQSCRRAICTPRSRASSRTSSSSAAWRRPRRSCSNSLSVASHRPQVRMRVPPQAQWHRSTTKPSPTSESSTCSASSLLCSTPVSSPLSTAARSMKALIMVVALRVLLRVAEARGARRWWCSCGAAVRCVMRLAAGMTVRRRLCVPKHCRLRDGLSRHAARWLQHRAGACSHRPRSAAALDDARPGVQAAGAIHAIRSIASYMQ